ncbi:glycine zipper 2TM domain-containing protein [Salinicola acroporae]|uniref:Glycine zipper 2TM domain-containing protein n=1 Tax=Salinicola acroporae TaxID=1541440 RepID=A0ABT6I536_9GAMM|nr:glycine zipper 2TM domain-containing protein [Salinicola acroporae]MDH4572652.1 hypothetical protein [Salinicola acroporae]
MKRLIAPALVMSLLALAGCTNNSTYSGDVYRGDQAGTAQSVSYGTIQSVRPVQIQGGNGESVLGSLGGAVIGGLLGNQVGGGSGRTIATAAGALGGTIAGSKIQQATDRVDGYELEIRQDSGQNVVVVQKADRNWQVGQRVKLVASGSSVSVAPY